MRKRLTWYIFFKKNFLNKQYIFQQLRWGYICTGFLWSIHNIPNSNLNWKQWILVRMLRMRRHLPLTVSFSAHEYKWISESYQKRGIFDKLQIMMAEGLGMGGYKFLWWNQVKFLQHSATKPMTGNLYFLNKIKN